MSRRAHGARAAALALGLLALTPAGAGAFPRFVADVPCDPPDEPCVLCHLTRDGGSGCAVPPCLDAFGSDLMGRPWSEAAALDSDGDGVSNGEELGDPEGTYVLGGPAARCACTTDPGDAASTPPLDADRDGVLCLDDCDDADPTIAECVCAVDADCDDRDPCTDDTCVTSASRCVHFAACGDASTRADGGSGGAGDGGCACRMGPAATASPTSLALLGLWLALRRRR